LGVELGEGAAAGVGAGDVELEFAGDGAAGDRDDLDLGGMVAGDFVVQAGGDGGVGFEGEDAAGGADAAGGGEGDAAEVGAPRRG